MIEDSRDVPDLMRLQALNATQGEIIILRSFQTFTKTTNVAEQRSPVGAEMIDVVLPEKQFWVPIGFKKRVGTSAGRVDFIFVGVNQTGVGMLGQLARNHRQRVFGEG